MDSITRFAFPLVLASLVLWLAACGARSEQGGDSAVSSTGDEHGEHEHGDHAHDGHDDHGNDEHGHDDHDHEGHDHGHDHPHGPHDGELIELAGAAPGETHHAEWTHDAESGLVTVYILDSQAKKERPIAAAEVTIEVRLQGKQPQTYVLSAVSTDNDGKASQFELQEPELLTSLKLKDAVDAQLHVEIDGKKLTGKVEYVEHGHHHH